MKVFWSIDEVIDDISGGALAIGNFDGVHIGHQALIQKAHTLNKKRGILSFSPHPSELLKQDSPHFYLTSDEQKISLFSRFGLDVAIIHRLDREFLELSPHNFIEDILVKKLKMKHVIVGDDFSYGKKALGDIKLLTMCGHRLGFETHIVEPVCLLGVRCSSRIIRNMLTHGNLFKANLMLGRPFSLSGYVQVGAKRGGTLGFKTANIIPLPGLGLCKGVYATITKVNTDSGREYISVTNVGTRPTITDEEKLVVENHCLDQELELYGQHIEIFFIERLREEQKFSSITALQEQVQKDCHAVRQMHFLYPSRFHVIS
jgi:riboflavin kinase/FMN adenylyltransferase